MLKSRRTISSFFPVKTSSLQFASFQFASIILIVLGTHVTYSKNDYLYYLIWLGVIRYNCALFRYMAMKNMTGNFTITLQYQNILFNYLRIT